MGGVKATPSITFAPEAGTQRLRDIINKGMTNQELRRGVVRLCCSCLPLLLQNCCLRLSEPQAHFQAAAYDAGWRHVKLYFMIGLPGETDDDVIGIADTVRFLQRETRGRGEAR